MPNLRKAKSKMLYGCLKKELFYAYLMFLILLHSIYKKCDVDHRIVIFLLHITLFKNKKKRKSDNLTAFFRVGEK